MAARARLPRSGRPCPDRAQHLADLKRDDLAARAPLRPRAARGPRGGEGGAGARVLFMTDNGLGLRVFPSLARIEAEVIDVVAERLQAPAEAAGVLTSGGTERIFLAAHAAGRWMWSTTPA